MLTLNILRPYASIRINEGAFRKDTPRIFKKFNSMLHLKTTSQSLRTEIDGLFSRTWCKILPRKQELFTEHFTIMHFFETLRGQCPIKSSGGAHAAYMFNTTINPEYMNLNFRKQCRIFTRNVKECMALVYLTGRSP